VILQSLFLQHQAKGNQRQRSFRTSCNTKFGFDLNTSIYGSCTQERHGSGERQAAQRAALQGHLHEQHRCLLTQITVNFRQSSSTMPL